MNFILENWVELALALITLAGSYTALTETTKDDNVLDIIKRIFDAVILGKNR